MLPYRAVGKLDKEYRYGEWDSLTFLSEFSGLDAL